MKMSEDKRRTSCLKLWLFIHFIDVVSLQLKCNQCPWVLDFFLLLFYSHLFLSNYLISELIEATRKMQNFHVVFNLIVNKIMSIILWCVLKY